ncbi:CDP-alcohol phosphatidyltransferase family protein [Rhizobium sp. C4]|uniref:CDP-alcohol phosphatidyltransferase family protein n=1 Tax=Rhizobium sp. C4 TaxID=1349800 RepID=UPI001E54EDD8|nr:CDP-alcohol phosphatidyltransferase family protein [Rhizobium sp. C4]MCD2171814.1 CDP-alcohol phosphatidyltransferase family protein [Rhizobium sp. C4]
MNIANIITVGRLLCVPAVLYCLLHGDMRLAFYIFLIAGLSDAVDGAIARRFNLRTELGAWMDPVADKLLMVSVFVMLAWLGLIPDWIVFLAVTRDALIVGAFLVTTLIGNPIKVAPLMVSKINTAFQIALVVTVLSDQAFGLGLGPLVTILLYLTALLTCASGASYLVVWMRHVAGSK